MKTIASTFAAVLIASAAFSSAAQASEGEYYEGVQHRPAGLVKLDRSTTGSIKSAGQVRQVRQSTSRDNGDYYQGVR